MFLMALARPDGVFAGDPGNVSAQLPVQVPCEQHRPVFWEAKHYLTKLRVERGCVRVFLMIEVRAVHCYNHELHALLVQPECYPAYSTAQRLAFAVIDSSLRQPLRQYDAYPCPRVVPGWFPR